MAQALCAQPDIIRGILSHLSAGDVIRAAQAHPDIFAVAQDCHLWTAMAARAQATPLLQDPRLVRKLSAGPMHFFLSEGWLKNRSKVGAACFFSVAIGSLVLLGLPLYVNLGIALYTGRAPADLFTDYRRCEQKKRAHSQAIRTQVRSDQAELVRHLRAAGVAPQEIPQVAWQNQAKSLAQRDRQLGTLQKALGKNLQRRAWPRVVTLLNILGPTARVSLNVPQLTAASRAAGQAGALDVMRWLVEQGAVTTAGLLAQLTAKATTAGLLNHLVAMGATLPKTALHHSHQAFTDGGVRPRLQRFTPNVPDACPNAAAADWPAAAAQCVILLDQARAQVALAEAGAPQLCELACDAVAELARQLVDASRGATDAHLAAFRAVMAECARVARRALKVANAFRGRAVEASAERPSAQRAPVHASHISGPEPVVDAASASLIHAAEDTVHEIKCLAGSLAFHAYYGPLRWALTAIVRRAVEAGDWPTLSEALSLHFPQEAAWVDAQGATVFLVCSVDAKFYRLIRTQQWDHATALHRALTWAPDAGPVQSELNAALHAAIAAQRWVMCKKMLDFGANILAPSNASPPVMASTRITCALQEAVGAGHVSASEALLGLQDRIGPVALPWGAIAAAAFPRTQRPRLGSKRRVARPQSAVQRGVVEALREAVVQSRWAAAAAFIADGVPVSQETLQALEVAQARARAQQAWDGYAQLTMMRQRAKTWG